MKNRVKSVRQGDKDRPRTATANASLFIPLNQGFSEDDCARLGPFGGGALEEPVMKSISLHLGMQSTLWNIFLSREFFTSILKHLIKLLIYNRLVEIQSSTTRRSRCPLCSCIVIGM